MSEQARVNLPSVKADSLAALNKGMNSAQQAVPVTIVRGKQKVSLVWSSVIYNLNPQPTPAGKTGKK